MRVFLDTSVLFADLAMLGARSQLILGQCRAGSFDVSIPEVILAEVRNHARQRIERDVSRITAGNTGLGRLGLAGSSAPSADVLVGEFERALRRRLLGHRVDLPGLRQVDHAVLVERSIAARKPFRASDKGYRDTLFWFEMLEAARSERVVLVTNDLQDFADAAHAGLHPHLCEDLSRMDRAGAVALFTSLEAFVDAHVPTSERVLAQVKRLIENDATFRDEVETTISRAVSDTSQWPYHVGLTLVEAEGPSMMGEESSDSTDVDDFVFLTTPEADHAWELDDEGQVVVEFTAEAEVRFSHVFTPTAGEWLVERGSNVDFYDQSESYWAGTTDNEVAVRLAAVFDPEHRTLEEPELTELLDRPNDQSDDEVPPF
ncbi:PIN domain-containing protein [Solirubrobacter phytolaccae]|uniref:PIN domain-containing protein n=1 Tax=Solirubrobacter phytolaccae TaxID=1404360 RepID=A0A9X3N7S0_9ACTN|nr:PIN domain-containing protein [Solirubrobacter phytolaccae]MDA0179949.1 PIN domain-containing protein [Solirubrobacter phytolaccae]